MIIDLIFFTLVLIFLLSGIRKEPTVGWRCTECKRKAIGTVSEVTKIGWDVTSPVRFICPDCRKHD
jgi:hypothetical protein